MNLSLDIEYTNYSKRFSPYAVKEKLLTVAAFDGKKQYFWNVNHPSAPKDDLTSLIELLNDSTITLIGHNLISDMLWLNVYLSDNAFLDFKGIQCKPFCTMIASDTLNLIDRDNGEKNDIESLAIKYTLNKNKWKGKINVNKLMEEPFELVKDYNLNDVIRTYDVWNYEHVFFNKKENIKLKRYFNWQMEIFKVLLKMMLRGIKVDKYEAYRVATELYNELNEAESTIFALCGEEFNIGSSKQLCNILYNKLKMPVLNVSEITGDPSADADAINAIKWEIKTNGSYLPQGLTENKKEEWLLLLNELKKFRGKSKLWNTYITKLPKFLEYDGRVHAKTNLGKGYGADPKKEYGTRTGRLSYSDPNLQQVPRENRMRGFYIADDGYVLIDPDYKQLELVILAFLSQDEKMIEAVELGRDLHTASLANIKHIDYDLLLEILANKKHPDYQEWYNLRKTIKPINFGIVFGIGVYHLQQVVREEIDEELSFAYLKKVREDWFRTYPKVKEMIEETQREARENGFVTTATGRVIVTPWAKINPKTNKHYGNNENVARNYRQAFNGKIQGFAVDVSLSAMLLIDQILPEYNLIQVHDSLLGRCKEDQELKTVDLIRRIMTKDVKKFIKDYFDVNINIPLNVDIKTGRIWQQ